MDAGDGEMSVRYVETFGSAKAGELVLVPDSHWRLSLAINKGNAARRSRSRSEERYADTPGGGHEVMGLSAGIWIAVDRRNAPLARGAKPDAAGGGAASDQRHRCS